MQFFKLTRNVLAVSAFILMPFAVSAQETKKEVHIKIVENGKVTKDTVYSVSGKNSDVEEMAEMEAQRTEMEAQHAMMMAKHAEMEAQHKEMQAHHMKERQVYVMSDSSMKNGEWTQKDGQRVEKHVYVMSDNDMKNAEWAEKHGQRKEVKVIVTSDDDKGMPMEVEEIWIDGKADGSPCKTIIIHEGNCPDNMKLEHMGPPPHWTEKPGNVEKKVIKTEGGEKVIIIETSDDAKPKSDAPAKSKDKKKK